MVAFGKHDRIHERAPAYWTHEVIIVRRDIVEQAEVNGRVVVLFSPLVMPVVILFHASPLL